jgi:hypothetical protein
MPKQKLKDWKAVKPIFKKLQPNKKRTPAKASIPL